MTNDLFAALMVDLKHFRQVDPTNLESTKQSTWLAAFLGSVAVGGIRASWRMRRVSRPELKLDLQGLKRGTTQTYEDALAKELLELFGFWNSV